MFQTFARALSAEHVVRLQARFEAYRRSGQIDEGPRLVEEMRAYGLDEGEAAALRRKLASTTATTADNAAACLARLRDEEHSDRVASSGDFVRASTWCRDHALPNAASALLARAEKILPGQPTVLDGARKLIPPGFPDAASEAAPLAWIVLAEAILPVAGVVLGPDDPVWKKAKAPWNDGALGLRTANIVLLSRERDPAIVGGCLRRGEETLRALIALLGAGLVQGKDSGELRRLEVRLHRNKQDYLAECTSAGLAMEWTAGFYSPVDNRSLFYVQREGQDDDPLERELDSVLAHELCHHFILGRWLKSGTFGQRG